MEYTYKFRIYPNKQHETLINKIFGCTRFVYNNLLEYKASRSKHNKDINVTNKCL